MPYAEEFGSRLSLADGQGDRRQALDVIGVALANGYITWRDAMYYRSMVKQGHSAAVLNHCNPMYEEMAAAA